MTIMKYLVLYFFVLSTIGCSQNESTKININNNIVKIITTRAYEANRKFEKLELGEPVKNLGFDKKMGLDWSWRKEYIDQYGNILRSETVDLPNQKTNSKTVILKNYFQPDSHKLSSIKTFQIAESDTTSLNFEQFIRNQSGQLIEIQKSYFDFKTKKDKIIEKVIFSYNKFGDKIKFETFENDGLKEKTEYVYDQTNIELRQLTKEVHESFGKFEFKEIFEYEKRKIDKTLKYNRKYYENNKLLSSKNFILSDYKFDIPSITIIEGYDDINSTVEILPDGSKVNQKFDKPESFKSTILKKTDLNGNVIEYDLVKQLFGEQYNELSNIHTNYKCKYTYNDKRDWIQIDFSPYNEVRYIIQREIEYLK